MQNEKRIKTTPQNEIIIQDELVRIHQMEQHQNINDKLDQIDNESCSFNQTRNWFITLFCEDPHIQFEKAIQFCEYAIGQAEIGNNTKKLHLQMYCNFKNHKRLAAIKKIWGQTIHAEPIRNVQNAIKYCSKNETRAPGDNSGPWVHGIQPSDRQKSNYKFTVEKALISTEEDLRQLDPSTYLSVKKVIAMCQTPYEHHEVRGLWIYGPPGTGKSTLARSFYKSYDTYIKQSDNQWFQGYAGQKAIIIDDLDSLCLIKYPQMGHQLKIWGDQFACIGEVKGGHVQLRHTLLIITSNFLPEHLWSDDIILKAIEERFNYEYCLVELPPRIKQKKGYLQK